jgi:hypothetical protein
MDLIAASYLSYLVYQKALAKEEKGWVWVFRFLSIWLFGSAMYYSVVISRAGLEFIWTPFFLSMLPIKLVLDFLLFGYFQAVLNRKPNPEPEAEADKEPPQDFSYFR